MAATRRIPFTAPADGPVNQDDGPMEPVPAYSATDDTSLSARIDGLDGAMREALNLPLTFYPVLAPHSLQMQRRYLPMWSSTLSSSSASSSPHQQHTNAAYDALDLAAQEEVHAIQVAIITSFFSSVSNRRDDLVTDFVSHGLISPDCPNRAGETPLLAAVHAHNPSMVRTLLTLGASPNAFGRAPEPPRRQHQQPNQPAPLRTPLQLAAAQGNLALVRYLVEDCGADDALVSPSDGALALRLAAEGAHREVVSYLPARRGGAWVRWRVAHEREMRAVRHAAEGILSFARFFAYHLPRFLLWDLPRESWRERRRFGRWCARQARELPGRAKRAAGSVVRGAKALPAALARAGRATWRAVQRIPSALRIVGLWIWRGLRAVADSLADIGAKVLGFLHTAVSAVVDFFRTITLKDVQDGLVAVLRALFVELPVAVWSFLARFGTVSYEVLKTLFGWVGQAIWYLLWGVWWVVRYIPKRLLRILEAISRSIAKAFQEVLVWFDPKRI